MSTKFERPLMSIVRSRAVWNWWEPRRLFGENWHKMAIAIETLKMSSSYTQSLHSISLRFSVLLHVNQTHFHAKFGRCGPNSCRVTRAQSWQKFGGWNFFYSFLLGRAAVGEAVGGHRGCCSGSWWCFLMLSTRWERCYAPGGRCWLVDCCWSWLTCAELQFFCK